MTEVSRRRDYDAQPVSVQLGLEAVIVGLSGDLTALRAGEISPNDALARAAVAKQLFNGVRLYLQAMKTLEALPSPTPEAQPTQADTQSQPNPEGREERS